MGQACGRKKATWRPADLATWFESTGRQVDKSPEGYGPKGGSGERRAARGLWGEGFVEDGGEVGRGEDGPDGREGVGCGDGRGDEGAVGADVVEGEGVAAGDGGGGGRLAFDGDGPAAEAEDEVDLGAVAFMYADSYRRFGFAYYFKANSIRQARNGRGPGRASPRDGRKSPADGLRRPPVKRGRVRTGPDKV